MKLVSFNISLKKDNTNAVTDFLTNINPDIVALQESMMPHSDSVFAQYRSGQDIQNAFKDSLPYSFFAPIYISKNITKSGQITRDFGGAVEQGTQLITKFPILCADNLFYYNEYRHEYDATQFRENDWSRSILSAVLELPNDKRVKIINVHGIWNKTKMGDMRTVRQSEFIIKNALSDDWPTIIVGDFNLLPHSESIKMLESHFINLCQTHNIKTTRPNFDDGLDSGNNVVDYIFISKDIKVNKLDVVNTDISDHLPLILDFDV